MLELYNDKLIDLLAEKGQENAKLDIKKVTRYVLLYRSVTMSFCKILHRTIMT